MTAAMAAAVAGSGPRTVGGSGRFGVWGMIPAKRRGAEQRGARSTVSICRKARRGAARSTGRRAGHRPVGGPVCGDVAPAGWTVRRDGTRTAPGTGQRLGRPGGTAGHCPASRKARQDSGPPGGTGRTVLRTVGRRAGHSPADRKARQDGGPPGGTGRTAAQPAVQRNSAPVGRKARGRRAGHGSVGRKARQGGAGRGRQRHRAVGRREPVNWTVWQGGWRDGCRGGAVRGRCAAGPSGVCGRAVRGEGSAGRPAGAADGHDGPTNGKDPLGA